MRALDAATIASVAPGDRESETKFNQHGVETSVIRTDGRNGRRAIQWFSYDFPIDGSSPIALVAKSSDRYFHFGSLGAAEFAKVSI